MILYFIIQGSLMLSCYICGIAVNEKKWLFTVGISLIPIIGPLFVIAGYLLGSSMESQNDSRIDE